MLALITGGGDLPSAVAEAAQGQLVVCTLRGHSPNALTPDITFRLETLGTLLGDLKARGVTQVCFCGGITRPSFDPSALDAATVPLVPRFHEALGQGDDGALRIVLALFHEAGFEILPAHIAAPDLLPVAGVLTAASVPRALLGTMGAAEAALHEMAAVDLGQACLLKDGAVIDREDDSGTNALIARAQPGAILFKAPKPGQDRRADLPVIGPDTVAIAAKVGLQGLVVEAGGVMVLHRAQTIAALDTAGMFLWVREGSGT